VYKSAAFLASMLVSSSAYASVGLLLSPTIPEGSHTQVLVVRAGKTTTVAARSLDFPQAIRIFPIYPDMKNIRVGLIPVNAFDTLNQGTSPILERWVEADPCGPAPIETVRPKPSLSPTESGASAKALKMEDLKKALGDAVLSEAQLEGLDHEAKLGAKFLLLKPSDIGVPTVTYDADLLELPTRLGQLNQSKTQYLRVFIVGDERFEVSNFWLSYLPTNIAIRPEAKEFEAIHQTVVSRSDEQKQKAFWVEFSGPLEAGSQPGIVTRLSHSSASGKLDDNLTLSPANPLVGGTDDDKSGAFGGEKSDFRIRYFSKEKYLGPASCPKPVLERWEKKNTESADAWPNDKPGVDLGAILVTAIPEIYASPNTEKAVPVVEKKAVESSKKEPETAVKTSCSTLASPVEGLGYLSILFGFFGVRRRR
jgi:hypothetical protein